MDTITLTYDPLAGVLTDGAGCQVLTGALNLKSVKTTLAPKEVISLKEAGFTAKEIIDMYESGAI